MGHQNDRKLFKVRVVKPNGKRVVYRIKARSSHEAAQQKQAKGRVISAVKVQWE